MCTVNIKLTSDQFRMIKAIIGEDADIAEWLQQQIEAILQQMVMASEKEKGEMTAEEIKR